jgi:hypothetical protein
MHVKYEREYTEQAMEEGELDQLTGKNVAEAKKSG